MTSKEANFVRVRLDSYLEAGVSEPTDLLCGVRALLKKIKQTVLVGDNVQVDAVDWADKRGKSLTSLVSWPHIEQHGGFIAPGKAHNCSIHLVSLSLNLHQPSQIAT